MILIRHKKNEKFTSRLFFGVIFLFFLLNQVIISQNLINKIKIEPLNRVVIYFDDFPIDYSTELSDDKKRITINIQNTRINDEYKRINSNGIITDIYSKILNSNVTLEVLLDEKRGYNTVPMPFTKTLIIEVFSWENLTADEDLFRTGLLSYEDKIHNSAKNDLTNSVVQGNKDAAGYLGILLLKMGKPNSALKNLLYAEKLNSNLPDIYAALAQIFEIKKDKVWFDYYFEKYKNQSGLPDFSRIEIFDFVETDSLITEPVEHLIELEKNIKTEETKVDTSKQNSNLNSKFSNIIGDSTKSENSGDLSIFPWWLSYILAFLGVILLLIIYFYFKWRNQRIQMINTITQENVKANIKASNPTIAKPKANKFAETYKKQEIYQQNEKSNATKLPSKPKKEDDSNVEFERDVKTKPKIDGKTRKEVENFLSTFKEKFPTKSLSEKIKGDLEKKNAPPVSAKVELAMHLAEEQQKIRARSLSTLDEKEIPKDENALSKVARQLGVEKGGLETRKNLEKIKSDSNSLKKLADKFSLNKKDDK